MQCSVTGILNLMHVVHLIGVLPDLKNGTQNGFDKDLSDTKVALLQTSFVISYMCFSPIFGYLGDRFIRKRLMVIGVVLWTMFSAAGSFAPVSYTIYGEYFSNCFSPYRITGFC